MWAAAVLSVCPPPPLALPLRRKTLHDFGPTQCQLVFSVLSYQSTTWRVLQVGFFNLTLIHWGETSLQVNTLTYDSQLSHLWAASVG